METLEQTLAQETVRLLSRHLMAMRAKWKASSRGHLRRCRKYGVPYQSIDYEEIFDRDGWRCGICGEEVMMDEASLDHIIPLSRGGSHTPENVQCAHYQCNIHKGYGVSASNPYPHQHG